MPVSLKQSDPMTPVAQIVMFRLRGWADPHWKTSDQQPGNEIKMWGNDKPGYMLQGLCRMWEREVIFSRRILVMVW
jgi:hypothetical protein